MQMAKSEIWQVIQEKWPTTTQGQGISYFDLADKMSSFLETQPVNIVGVNHFGVVVEDIDISRSSLDSISRGLFNPAPKVWVESYKVYVGRFSVNNLELELIEPSGKSFFANHLREYGQTLQHISFGVTGIEKALQFLKQNCVELIDEMPRKGAHGKVAFANPHNFRPWYLELCEINAEN
jgi:hypothetical protein